MNLEQALTVLGNATETEVPVAGIEAVKSHWSEFYPELERIIDQFIADDTSLTEQQESALYFGTLLLAELQYSPALEKCLQLFARNDTFLSPLEGVFGDVLTELTPTLFYNVVDGNTQALCNYIVDGHQAMYCKASAIEAVFSQYEAGIIDEFVLSDHVTRWLAVFLALPSSTNSFLLSALADYCIEYQLDDFKPQFTELCGKGDNNVFDEERFSQDEVKAWSNTDATKFIASGFIETEFNLVDTLNKWVNSADDSDDELFDHLLEKDADIFDSLTGEGGLLSNILFDENTILENSVPVSSLTTAGRNDPCPCGSGKKYKKCCLQ